MLDLEPRVHLEEREAAAVVEQELARPRAHVADGAPERQRRLAHALAQCRVDGGRRRLLEDLLVAALDRAVALAEVDPRAVAIEQDLDLDVARADHEAFEDEPVIAEGGCRLASGRGDRVGESPRGHGPCACPCRRRPPPA